MLATPKNFGSVHLSRPRSTGKQPLRHDFKDVEHEIYILDEFECE